MAERALEHRVIRCRDTSGQHQWVEVDVPRGAGVVTLHLIERQCSHVHLLPFRRPRDAGVVGRVARLSNDDDEMPACRLAVNLCNQSFEKLILILGYRGSACRFERLSGRQDPAYRDGVAGCVGEAKRIEAMERAILKP